MATRASSTYCANSSRPADPKASPPRSLKHNQPSPRGYSKYPDPRHRSDTGSGTSLRVVSPITRMVRIAVVGLHLLGRGQHIERRVRSMEGNERQAFQSPRGYSSRPNSDGTARSGGRSRFDLGVKAGCFWLPRCGCHDGTAYLAPKSSIQMIKIIPMRLMT